MQRNIYRSVGNGLARLRLRDKREENGYHRTDGGAEVYMATTTIGRSWAGLVSGEGRQAGEVGEGPMAHPREGSIR